MWAMKKKWTLNGVELEDYSIPKGWWCPTCKGERKYNSLINCASCGDLILYAPGRCYASSVITDAVGSDFMVCPKCRKAEIKEADDWLAHCMEVWGEEQREAERKTK